jgi:hypothetical protein
MEVPKIGSTKGIFEIFVPGLFLFINFIAVLYFLPFNDSSIKTLITSGISNPFLALVTVICFGYLIGVIIRLFKTNLPDRLSAKMNKWIILLFKKDKTIKLWTNDHFPYIGWIGELCSSSLPPYALNFYEEVWKPRNQENKSNHAFFNFCKTIISSVDINVTNEIYSAEALNCYISGIFYSLTIAFFLLLLLEGLLVICHKFLIIILLVMVFYALGVVAILVHYRKIKIREVELVFAATFKHSKEFREISEINSNSN